MVAEECSELAKAALKLVRAGVPPERDRDEWNALIDEAADVWIMLNQVALMVPDGAVEEARRDKIERLQRRLAFRRDP